MFPLENPKNTPPTRLRTADEIRTLLGKSGENVDRTADQFVIPGVDPNEFRFQVKAGQDNFRLRAQDQGFWESLGIKAANLVPNILAGITEQIGYAGALLTETGKERDYSNSLTQLMKEWRNPFGEVYLENPGDTFDLTDSAWWINHIGDLAESVGEFAATGMGVGKAFLSAAKLAGTMGRGIGAAANMGARVGTAATLAYTEGAMSGYDIYERTFNYQYDKLIQAGLSPNEAKSKAMEKAADAASSTVQLNTIMNTALNMTALAPLFKNTGDDVINFMRSKGAPLKGETAQQFTKRITAEATEAGVFKGRGGISSYLGESLQEGLEEVNTQYAEAEGRRVGEGKEKNLLMALTDFEQAIKDISNEEGALNFLLGAVGGIGQTAIVDNVPIHKVAKLNADGSPVMKDADTPVMQRVSSRVRNLDGTRKYFGHVANVIAEDIGYFEKKFNELKEATDKKNDLEAERIRQDIFDVTALNAVSMGVGEHFINTLKDIADTSNTVQRDGIDQQLEELNQQMLATDNMEERAAIQQQKNELLEQAANLTSDAVSKGLARDLNDNSYKQSALDAIEDIKHYQKLHDSIHAKYNSEEEKQIGVPDYIFAQAAAVYRQKRILNKAEADLLEQKAEYEDMYGAYIDPENYNKLAHLTMLEANTQQQLIARVQADFDKFNEAVQKGDLPTLERIMDKYRIVGAVGPTEAVKRLGKMMETQIKTAAKARDAALDRLSQESGYAQYKQENPDKTLTDFQKMLEEKFGRREAMTAFESWITELRTRLSTNQVELSKLMEDSDNVAKVVRKLTPEIEKRNKAFLERQRKAAIDKELRETALAAHNERNQLALETHRNNLEKSLADLTRAIQQKEQEIAALKEKIRNFKLTEHSIWNLPWQAKMLKLQYKLNKAVEAYDDLRERKIGVLDALDKNSAELLELSQTTDIEDASQAEVVTETTETAQDGTASGEEAGTANTATKTSRTRKPKATGPKASPAAKKLAEENGIDWTTITGTGKNGMIPKADIEAALSQNTVIDELETEGIKNAEALLLKEAQERYISLLEENIPGEAHIAFAKYEELLKTGTVDLNDDTVFTTLPKTREIAEKGLIWIFSKEVQETLEALRAYVALLPAAKEENTGEQTGEETKTEDQRTTEEKWDQATEKEKLSTPTLEYPDQPTTSNGPDIATISRKHDEFKTVSILKISSKTLNTVDYTNSKGDYRIGGFEFNPNLHPDILNPDKLRPGTKITLVLDTEYQGEVRQPGYMNRTKEVSYADFIDETGKVTDIMNVPIKILNDAGEVLGYLPSLEWLTDRYAGTSGKEAYRNIVSQILGPDGTLIDNLATQKTRLMKLRRLITDANAPVEAIIDQKGPGRVIMYAELEGNKLKYKRKPAAEMLPDKTLEFAVVNQGTVNVGYRTPVAVNNTQEMLVSYHNAPMVLLPMADGTRTAAPLYMDDLDSELDHRTVERAIWLYLNRGNAAVQEELETVRQKTGYDFRNDTDLRQFITQQYTYLQSFDASHTAHNPEADNQNFLFNITSPGEGGALIMVGFANSGKKPVVAKLKDGQLTNAFREALYEGLATRQRNVNYTKGEIQGINSYRAFSEAVYTSSGWKVSKHDTYNDFIKAHALTYVDGRNKQEDRYVYAANPMITFDDKVVVKLLPGKEANPVLIPDGNPEDKPAKPAAEELTSDELEDFGNILGLQTISDPMTIVTSIEQPVGMPLISLEMLQDLHNFTPPGQRNGKSPEQIFEELRKSGVPYLADGHNPFTKCG